MGAEVWKACTYLRPSRPQAKSPRVDKAGQMQPCVRAAVVPHLSACLSHAGFLSPAVVGLPGSYPETSAQQKRP